MTTPRDGRQGSKAPGRLGSRTCLPGMLLVPSTVAAGSNMVFFLALDYLLCVFYLIYFSSFLLPGSDKAYERSRVVWVDDEPALLVSYCFTPRSRA